jgi:hypothetical protein
MTIYKIEFKERGEVVQTWDRYFSHGEALRAIRDADLIIPFSWEWEIIPYEKAPA